MAIRLEKFGDQHKVNLTKENMGGKQEIVIHLNWSQEKKTGFLASLLGGSQEVDLDLGCYYEMNTGERMIIDGLQFAHGQGGGRNIRTRQGCYDSAPFIWHKGDDRGNVGGESGEYIYVNPKGVNYIKKIIVYTFIYEGAPNWTTTNAVVTVKVPGNENIVVEMGSQNDRRNFCAIAELLFDGSDSVTVRKLVTFHKSHAECDKHYGWGFKWQEGSKD